MQSLDRFALRCRVAVNDSPVTLVGDSSANITLIVRDHDALTVSAVIVVQLHHGVQRRAASCKEIQNDAIGAVAHEANVVYKLYRFCVIEYRHQCPIYLFQGLATA